MTPLSQKMPTEHRIATIGVLGAKLLGSGSFLSIAYMLEPEQLSAERARFTELLDRMNGRNSFWREFEPHVSVATIDRLNASQVVLDSFSAISPESLRFETALAAAT